MNEQMPKRAYPGIRADTVHPGQRALKNLVAGRFVVSDWKPTPPEEEHPSAWRFGGTETRMVVAFDAEGAQPLYFTARLRAHRPEETIQ